MNTDRRSFILSAGGGFVSLTWSAIRVPTKGEKEMYGLIGKMTVATGQRDALIAILLESVDNLPGCLSYVVAKDSSDANAIWITEVWDSKASREASLSLPSVRQAIARGRPLITGFSNHVVTEPVGGYGLKLSQPEQFRTDLRNR